MNSTLRPGVASLKQQIAAEQLKAVITQLELGKSLLRPQCLPCSPSQNPNGSPTSTNVEKYQDALDASHV